jgi:hypothetical protein
MFKTKMLLAGTILIISITLYSCAFKTIPIKGQYPEGPYQDTTTLTKDAVWDKIIDFYAQKGLSIKIIDRSSGLIISDRTVLTTTFEDNKGQPIKPAAWIVLPKTINPNDRKPFAPGLITGEWNIRIKELSDKRTSINVNLVNINGTEEIIAKVGTSYKTTKQAIPLTRYKSTGNFEKMITEYIK